jgi:hypothetical protein
MPLLDQPLVWTPSAVKAELDRVRGFLDSVNVDVSAATGAKKLTDAEWKAWRQLYEAAHKFVDDASTLWGGNAVQARDYEQQAARWRDLVQSRGVKVTGTAARQPTTSWDTTALLTVFVVGYVAFKILDKR